MEIKQFTMLAVGLIVGVLLITGVVAPVIANVSSDDGGSGSDTDSGDNSEKDFYKKASANDSLTLWAWYDNDGPDDADNTYICDGNPEGADPVTKWESSLPCLIGEDWYMELGASGSVGNFGAYFTVRYSVEYDFGQDDEEEGQYVEINGTDVTIYNIYTNESATYHNLLYYSYPEGDFVSCISYDEEEDEDIIIQPYLDSTSDIAIPISLFVTDNGMCDLMIYGTPADNSVKLVKEYNDVNISSYGPAADISIQNGKLTGISIVVDDVTYTVDVITYMTGPDQDVILRNLIVPCVTDAGSNIDGGGSGGSSGLSPTLTTILSVIPLVLTVGLVIGAIGFLRMKN